MSYSFDREAATIERDKIAAGLERSFAKARRRRWYEKPPLDRLMTFNWLVSHGMFAVILWPVLLLLKLFDAPYLLVFWTAYIWVAASFTFGILLLVSIRCNYLDNIRRIEQNYREDMRNCETRRREIDALKAELKRMSKK